MPTPIYTRYKASRVTNGGLMTFGSMRIGKYLLSRRIFTADPSSAETMLEFRQHSSGTGPVQTVMVYFTDRVNPGTLAGDMISVLLWPQEFDLWYKVVQIEDPVWVGWATSDTDPTLIDFIGLYTSEEPPGESIDISPY